MRATTTVLLLTSDKTVVQTVQSAAAKTKGCELEWCTDAARVLRCARRRGRVGLIVLHVQTAVDVAQAGCILREASCQPSPVPTIVLCEDDALELRLKLLRQGAVDCLTWPLDPARLTFLIDILTVRARYEAIDTEAESVLEKSAAYRQESAAGDYLFDNPTMSRLLDQIRAIAARDTTVLVLGETGTGKTHLARVIHDLSPRRDKPFMVVHCGALTPTLLESELFGHVRGSFTHADRDRVGKLAEVQDGTLLLDEVDCIPLDSQVKLLRAVEERIFEPVGSNKSYSLRARLIAAANRPLEQDVKVGRFRSDLYYRLNVVSFCLPPLRERRELVRPLVHKFLRELAAANDGGSHEVAGVSEEALQVMEAYHWPGNVRELRNMVERAVALCVGRTIDLEDLPEMLGRTEPSAVVQPAALPPTKQILPSTGNQLADARSSAELRRLTEALQRNNNNRTEAAADLGISRVTLYKKLRRYGLA